ncbi:MAG: hypothetical protein ACPL4I_12180, partial [Bacteroidota bacterium]
MVLSAFLVISSGAYAQTASGTVTYTPNVVTVAQVEGSGATGYSNPVIVANGGTFSSVTEFYFYWSTTNSISGLIGSTYAFKYEPQAGSTTFVNALLVPNTGFSASGITPGETLYLLASPSSTLTSSTSGATVMGSTPFTVSPYTPEISTSSSAPAGRYIEISGSGFAPTATSAAVYIDVNGVNTQIGTIQLSNGYVMPYQYVLVPNNLPYGTYLIYALDPVGGELASASLTITEAITVSPMSITGSTSSTFTINGYGFPAGAVISPYSTTATAVTLTDPSGASVNAIQAGATVGSNGQFTLTVTGLSAAVTTPGPQKITISWTSNGAPDSASFSNAIYVSSPNPAQLGFIFFDKYTAPAAYGYPDDPAYAAVFDFPANTQVNVMLGSYLVGTIMTDSNGFGMLPKTAVIPEMPYGAYFPVASVPSMGLYASTSPFEVLTLTFGMDPAGNVLPEYVPQTGMITVYAYGLNPTDYYAPYDTGF